MSTRAYLEALRDEMDIFITTVEASQVELGQMEVASEAAHKDLAIAKTVGSSVNIAGKAGLIFGIVCPPLLLAGGITHAVGTMTNMATDVVHAGFHGSFGAGLEIIAMDVNACHKRLMSTAARYKDVCARDVILLDIDKVVTPCSTFTQLDELLLKEFLKGGGAVACAILGAFMLGHGLLIPMGCSYVIYKLLQNDITSIIEAWHQDPPRRQDIKGFQRELSLMKTVLEAYRRRVEQTLGNLNSYQVACVQTPG